MSVKLKHTQLGGEDQEFGLGLNQAKNSQVDKQNQPWRVSLSGPAGAVCRISPVRGGLVSPLVVLCFLHSSAAFAKFLSGHGISPLLRNTGRQQEMVSFEEDSHHYCGLRAK